MANISRNLIISLIFLAACNGKDNNNKGVDSTGIIDSEKIKPQKEHLQFKIASGQIGSIQTGDSLTKTLEKLKDFQIKNDSVRECEGCDTYDPIYRIMDDENLELFSIEPGWDSTSVHQVFRIRTKDPRFKTSLGIGVGSTINEVKNKYEITGVDTHGETGLHIFINDFEGSFGVEKPDSQDWWSLTSETIPDTLEVEEIIIL